LLTHFLFIKNYKIECVFLTFHKSLTVPENSRKEKKHKLMVLT